MCKITWIDILTAKFAQTSDYVQFKILSLTPLWVFTSVCTSL